MNGAIAEDSVNINSNPRISKSKIIGRSHHLLRVFKKSHISFKKEILLILPPFIGRSELFFQLFF